MYIDSFLHETTNRFAENLVLIAAMVFLLSLGP